MKSLRNEPIHIIDLETVSEWGKKRISNVKVMKSGFEFKFIHIKPVPTLPLPHSTGVLCYPCSYHQIVSLVFISYSKYFHINFQNYLSAYIFLT